MRITPRAILEFFLASAVYALCVLMGIQLTPEYSYQSIFIPATGFALGVVLLRPSFFVVGFIVVDLIFLPVQPYFKDDNAGFFTLAIAIVMPAFQALLSKLLITRYCGNNLWVFDSSFRLWRLVLVGACLPALLASSLMIFSLQLRTTFLQYELWLDIARLFFAYTASIAVITPTLLLLFLKNPVVTARIKAGIAIPIVGWFLLASVSYASIYRNFANQLYDTFHTELDAQYDHINSQAYHAESLLKIFREWLWRGNGQDITAERFAEVASRVMATQAYQANSTLDLSFGLIEKELNIAVDMSKFAFTYIYPQGKHEVLVGLPLSTQRHDESFFSAVIRRNGVRTFPGLDMARMPSGDSIMLLLHNFSQKNEDKIIAALVDTQGLSDSLHAQYADPHRAFIINDVMSGRNIYESKYHRLAQNPANVIFHETMNFGDRVWRLTLAYDFVWVGHRLQSDLLFVSLLLLIIMSIFTLLILSSLVSAQSLEKSIRIASKNLEEERRFLDAVFESLPLFIFVKDAITYRYVRVNRHVEKILGTPRGLYEDKSDYDIYPEESAVKNIASDRQVLKQGDILDVGKEKIESPLGVKWIHTRKSLVLDPEGRPRYILGVSEDITDSRLQHNTLHSLLNHMPNGVVVFDFSGVAMHANDSARKIFSLDVVGKLVGDILPGLDFHDEIKNYDFRSMIEVEVAQAAINHTHKSCFTIDNKKIIVEVSIFPSVWESQPAIFAYISNISERVDVQKSLQMRELQFELLMASIGEGVCSIDCKGEIQFINDSACKALGCQSDKVVGSDFVTRFTLGDSQKNIISALADKSELQFDKGYFKNIEGNSFQVSYSCSPLLSNNGAVVGAVIIFRDKADAVAYEDSIADQNELIGLGLDAVGIGSWEWQLDSGRVSLSPQLYEILDISQAQEISSINDFQKIIHHQDIEQVKIVDLMARKNADVTDICCRVATGNGQIIWITGKYRYFYDANGDAIRARGVAWDSTEEMLLQEDNHRKTEALKRSNKELDDFAYIASHDLKEPLRGISNYANFLLEDYSKDFDAEGLHMLSSLVRLSSRMDGLISDLLNYSKLGRTELAHGMTNIDKMVVDILELIMPLIEEKAVSVIYESKLQNIVCDEVRMREVFRNLITNAIKYNKNSERKIYLGSFVEDDATVFYVRDNGIGIPEDLQPIVFDVFKRLHGFSEYGGGTGIGLSIVKKVIDQHGGRLWLESQEGEGSTFYFSIPEASS